MESRDIDGDLTEILIEEEQIRSRLAELSRRIESDYAGKDLLLVGVLKGAVMVMADLARELKHPITMDWMAVSSYGSGTASSGVVRILKDLDTDLTGRNVLIVEDIIDSGLTLSWLLANLNSRGPASVEICALLRKPDAARVKDSRSRTSSSSATASTTPRSTATSARSACSPPTFTLPVSPARCSCTPSRSPLGEHTPFVQCGRDSLRTP
jgi:hypoxanthine phosphoribosyltransferase